jgi:predicted nucleic acid-binding protein
MIERGLLRSAFAFESHRSHVLAILRKYRDLPTSFADACLVAMAETDSQPRILTVDSDFKIYRKRNRRVLPLIFPG